MVTLRRRLSPDLHSTNQAQTHFRHLRRLQVLLRGRGHDKVQGAAGCGSSRPRHGACSSPRSSAQPERQATSTSVSTPSLVTAFYERIWNAGDFAAVPELLAEGFVFRGSLGSETRGHQAFKDYVCSVRCSLSNYHCEILDCVAEGDRAFARMRFSGLHTGVFRGHQPTRKEVQWLGAALFHFEHGVISQLWVLGDLTSLDHVLTSNRLA